MAVKLEINPLSPSLDLLGPPDQSSAYSLSGHISISLTSSHSLFERRHAIRILLQSLVVTFEGQAELVTQETGYSALRLCSISKELVPKTTVELTNEGHEDGDRPCTWHVMFDLPIPGWLPASDLYGDCRQGYSGTQYNLYASMKFTNSEESCGPSWLSALCTQFSSKNKIVYAEACRITLNRFALPPRSVSYPPTFYSITPNGEAPRPEGNPYPIPADIVSKIELFASIPEHVNVDEDKFPFTLSIRASSLSESQAAKLRVTQLSLELQQTEKFSASASAYAASYPVPSLKDQPPNRPLRGAHPVHALYEIGLLARPNHLTLDDVHSLLPGYKRVDVPLNRADHARKCAEGLHPTRWFTMEALIPFTQTLTERKHENLEWAGTPRLRVTSWGPFFNVKHSMRVVVALSYDDADGKPPATSFLSFSLSLKFVRLRGVARTLSTLSESLPERLSSPDSPVTMPRTHPYNIPDLPAYSQLFYPNGDAKYDDSIPLPLYTPSLDSPPPTPSLGNEEDHLTSDVAYHSSP